ncbi:MAG: hypothetical protein JWN25_1736 [Verrucomicrobiales bacterium]|nr:hypothetical protein [Verrucomicrobiales bacterium]
MKRIQHLDRKQTGNVRRIGSYSWNERSIGLDRVGERRMTV